MLILGWNGKAQAIIEELDNYVAAGLGDHRHLPPRGRARHARRASAKRMQRQRVRFADGDITHAATLAAVEGRPPSTTSSC